MSNLKYKTKGNTSPKGKPKVYFCCHSEDFDAFWEIISDEILAKHNCAIWYAPASIERNEDFFEDLKQMQLFVMPVTTNLLCTKNYALDIEFKFACENHIPVLPLLQETGLEQLFNQKCGDLQFLDKNNTDLTAISYDEKLQKYLESVLVNDALAEKIRFAFDAYVFLSYRKKDRRYAQELMKLIHKNEFCRDIAIWYDEFLTPGQNFNDAIKDALQKSDLFVLTVTPNIVNEDNYVQSTEYPMAQKERKFIIPIEVVPTDRKQLYEKYKALPPLTNAYDEFELSNTLIAAVHKVALKEKDSSPEHRFLIGLAYLNGIDVEVDHSRALSLIASAAEDNLPMAAEKLFTMYLNGIGVGRDLTKAEYWKTKEIQLYRNQFIETHTEEHFVQWFSHIEELDNFYRHTIGNTEKIISLYADIEQMIPDAFLTSGHLTVASTIGRLYMDLGSYYSEQKDIERAEAYLQKAANYIQGIHTQQKSILSSMVTDDLGSSVAKMAEYYISDHTQLSLLYASLAHFFLKQDKNTLGEQYLLAALETRQELCDLLPDHYVLEQNLILAFLDLSHYYLAHNAEAEAEKFILSGENRATNLLNQTHDLYSGELLMRLVSLHAIIYLRQQNMQKAINCYTFCIDQISRSAKTPLLIRMLAENYINLADAFIQTKQFNEAFQQLENAKKTLAGTFTNQDLLLLTDAVKEKIYTNPTYVDGVSAYYRRLISQNQQAIQAGYSDDKLFESTCLLVKMAHLYSNAKQYESAKSLYVSALKSCKFLLGSKLRSKAVPYAYAINKNLCFIYKELGNYKKAEKHLLQLIKIAKKNLTKDLDDVAYRFLISAYQDVGDYFHKHNKLPNAKKYYNNALGYADLLLRMFANETNQDFVAELYFKAAILDPEHIEVQLLKFAQDHWKEQKTKHPNTTLYSEKIKMAEEFLCVKSG